MEKNWLDEVPSEDEETANIPQKGKKLYTAEGFFFHFIAREERLMILEKYIPLDEIEKQLISCIGDKCDVEKIIADYIENTNKSQKKKSNDSIEYDIELPIDLLLYKKGDSIHPELLENFTGYIAFYKSLLNEDEFLRLKDTDWEVKCISLIMDAVRAYVENDALYEFCKDM